MISATLLFILAGIGEIGGGYLIWLWLREGKPFYWGVIGGIVLALYGVVATFQSFPTFGRVYAAYGGVLLSFPFCGAGESTEKTRHLRFRWSRHLFDWCFGDFNPSFMINKIL